MGMFKFNLRLGFLLTHLTDFWQRTFSTSPCTPLTCTWRERHRECISISTVWCMAWKKAHQKYISPITTMRRNLQEDGEFIQQTCLICSNLMPVMYKTGRGIFFFPALSRLFLELPIKRCAHLAWSQWARHLSCFEHYFFLFSVDSFMVKTKFVGLVDRITIEHDNTGILPDWNLDKVLTLPSQYEKLPSSPLPA